MDHCLFLRLGRPRASEICKMWCMIGKAEALVRNKGLAS
jgi:hypothetical protein